MIEEAYITARNLFSLVVLRILQYPLMALFIMIVPRIMGPEMYGKFAFFSSILVILGTLTRLGTIEIQGRFVPELKLNQEKSIINKLTINILILRTIILIIIGIIILSLLYFFPLLTEDLKLYLIIIIATFFFGIEGTLFNLLYGVNDIVKFTARDMIRKFFNLLLVIIFFKYFNLLGAVLALLISEFFLLAFAIYWTREYFNFKDLKLDLIFMKPYLKFGFMYYISSVIIIVLQYSGNPLIQIISKNPAEVAFFDLANQIYFIISNFMLFIFSSMIPVFTTLLLKKREDKILKWSSLILKYAGIINIIVFGLIILIGRDMVILTIGDEYEKVSSNISILAIGLFAFSISQMGMVYSIIFKKPDSYLKAITMSLIVYFILSLILIPEYASVGSSIATSISIIVLGVLLSLQFGRFMKVVSKYFFKVSLLGFVLLFFIYYYLIFLNNFERLILFIISYSFLLFILKYITLFEIKEFIYAVKGKDSVIK